MEKVRRVARHGATRAFGALGYELVRRHYYSPIPDVSSLPPTVWTKPSDLPGVSFDPAAGLGFVRRELGPYLADYRPPRKATSDPRDFYLDNGMYGSVDAETLFAMVRRFAPSRILELGSGMSTLVIADARRLAQDAVGPHVVYDPYPRPELTPALESVAELRPLSATDVPQAEFAALGAGDLLFIDTTHTVKIGGDVNRVILDVFPGSLPESWFTSMTSISLGNTPRSFLRNVASSGLSSTFCKPFLPLINNLRHFSGRTP